MGNPLYNMFNNNNNIVSQFMRFKNGFNGDARTQVQELLNSGKVSQEQYNRAVEMAKQLQQILK